MTELQSNKEALILALQLAITAPSQKQADLCFKKVMLLAGDMSEEEIEACKALALAAVNSGK